MNTVIGDRRVLYLVGRVAPTSTALEVAHHMENSRVQVHVVSYYQTDYEARELPLSLTRIGATGQFDLRGIWRLYRCISEYRPDVIHVHHTVSAFWAVIFGRLLGVKVIKSEHNNSSFYTPLQWAINTVSRLLADIVLCNSENTYRNLGIWQKKLLGDRCEVVYNGVDIKRIERGSLISSFFGVNTQAVTIGSVGRLIEQKNYERLLQAFSRVVATMDEEVRLVLVGDGDNRSQIEREVSRLGLEEQVTLTGEIKRDKVYAALHSFDVFVMPSLSEGFCNAVVEAMAAGLPIVCADIPTLREVVGEAAVFADPLDPSDMSESLLKLLRERKGQWKERGKRVQKLAAERYSVEHTAKEYIRHYKNI